MTPKAAKVTKTSSRATTASRTSPVPSLQVKPTKLSGKNTTLGQKAGLQFNVSKFLNKLKKGHYAKIIRKGAAVYLAGVIEYLAAEILELSGDVAKVNKRVRITPRNVMVAVKTDDELNKLFGKVDLPGVGTLPHIHAVLLPKKTRRRRRSSNKENAHAGPSQTTDQMDTAAY